MMFLCLADLDCRQAASAGGASRRQALCGPFDPECYLSLDLYLQRCGHIISIIKGAWYDHILMVTISPRCELSLADAAIEPERLGNALVMTRTIPRDWCMCLNFKS
jgi:hypothetical protein